MRVGRTCFFSYGERLSVDNSEWRKHQKSSWPTGSLERSLVRDFPGCKSAIEALNKTIKSITPTEIAITENKPVIESELDRYIALRESIKTIENYEHHGFNTWLVPDHVRTRLNAMPIHSVEEARLWRDSWVKEIKKIKEMTNGKDNDNGSSL